MLILTASALQSGWTNKSVSSAKFVLNILIAASAERSEGSMNVHCRGIPLWVPECLMPHISGQSHRSAPTAVMYLRIKICDFCAVSSSLVYLLWGMGTFLISLQCKWKNIYNKWLLLVEKLQKSASFLVYVSIIE